MAALAARASARRKERPGAAALPVRRRPDPAPCCGFGL